MNESQIRTSIESQTLHVYGPKSGELITASEIVEIICRQRNLAEAQHFDRIIFQEIRIAGYIDLSNTGDQERPLPRLRFSGCVIEAFISRYSFHQGLVFADCDIGQIDISESNIQLELNILDTRSDSESPIRCVNTKIDGSCLISGVATSASKVSVVFFNFFGLAAKSLNVAKCRDGITLNLANARISGDLRLCSNRLHPDAFGVAIRMNGLQVGKVLRICCDTDVLGQVTGNLIKVGSHFTFFDVRGKVEQGNWFRCDKIEVGGSLQFDQCQLSGQIAILGGSIGLNCRFTKSEIFALNTSQDASGRTAIDLHRLSIAGELRYESETTIHGEARFMHIEATEVLLLESSFLARDVGYSVTFKACHIRNFKLQSCQFKGMIHVVRSHIDGFNFSRIHFPNITEQKALLGESYQILELSDCKLGTLNLSKINTDDVYLLLDLYASKIKRITSERTDWWSDEIGNERAKNLHEKIVDFFLRFSNTKNIAKIVINFEQVEYDDLTQAITPDRLIDDQNKIHAYMAKRSRDQSSQPYAYLASYLNRMGQRNASERVMLRMMRYLRQNQERWYQRPFSLIFDAGFGYGYSKIRAAITGAVWIAIGSMGVSAALNQEQLVLDTQVVTSVAVLSDSDANPKPSMPIVMASSSTIEPILCGNQIDPTLYAIDMIVPIYDFGQTKLCTVKSSSDIVSGLLNLDVSSLWWIAKYLYTFAGWVILSMGILTFTGTLKSRSSGNS